MGKFIKTKESNLLLGTGDNPNTVDMHALRVVDNETGEPFIFGCYDLDSEQIAEIIRSGKIWIGVMGNGWPPMMPTTSNPLQIGFNYPERGLPPMQYREEVTNLLREVFYSPDWMDEDTWLSFLEFMSQRFNFYEFGRQLVANVADGRTIEEQLAAFEVQMRTVLSEDFMNNFKEANDAKKKN